MWILSILVSKDVNDAGDNDQYVYNQYKWPGKDVASHSIGHAQADQEVRQNHCKECRRNDCQVNPFLHSPIRNEKVQDRAD